MRRIAWFGLLPLLIYTIGFFIYTWPMLLLWRTHFYCIGGDGLQNEWNFWWIDKAVTQLHQSVWFTTYLHYPQGSTLIGHTLNPIHGFLVLPLRHIMPAVQVYNLIITACFALSGLTAFWLAHHLTNKYWPSILGGFAFTFTGYHFAHLGFHMQLLAMEFLPLMLLLWLRLLENPTYGRSTLAAAGVALLVACDWYYLMYSAIACLIILLWNCRSLTRQHWKTLALFGILSAIIVAPLAVPLVQINSSDPLLGSHPASQFSADPLAIFIPGGASWLGRFTEKIYWSKLPGNYHESSVYIGISVLVLALIGLIARPKVGKIWLTIAISCYLLSLGPVLIFLGKPRTGDVLPYHWLEVLVPPFRMTGVPVRTLVMTALSSSMLAAIGFSRLWEKRRVTLMIVLAIVMLAELWPRGIDCCPDTQPLWVHALRDLPDGAVICKTNDDICMLMYYQTIHEKPMALGLLARIPQSVEQKSELIIRLVFQNQFSILHDFGFRYIVCYHTDPHPELKAVYQDDQYYIYELGQ